MTGGFSRGGGRIEESKRSKQSPKKKHADAWREKERERESENEIRVDDTKMHTCGDPNTGGKIRSIPTIVDTCHSNIGDINWINWTG